MRIDAEIVGAFVRGGVIGVGGGRGRGFLCGSHNKSLDANICNTGDVFFYFTLLIPRQSWDSQRCLCRVDHTQIHSVGGLIEYCNCRRE